MGHINIDLESSLDGIKNNYFQTVPLGDEELIRFITRGSLEESKAALGILYERYSWNIWSYIRGRVGCDADADDIAAETWYIAIKKIYGFIWGGTSIKFWLLGIARRKILEFYRFPLLSSYEELEADDSDTLKSLYFIATQLHLLERTEEAQETSSNIKQEADKILHEIISELPPSQRQIIILMYFDNVESMAEIAKRLSMKESTVRVYHLRAKEKIRKSPKLAYLFKMKAKTSEAS